MTDSWFAVLRSHITRMTQLLRTFFLEAVDAYMYTISFYLATAHTYLPPTLVFLHDCIDVTKILPTALMVFVIIIVRIQHIRSETLLLFVSPPDTSAVSGRYGPGSYYAWLFNIVVACQSEPINAQAQSYSAVASLVVNAYSIAAAIDQLERTLNPSLYSQPILDASDRINMLGWITATVYLLRQSYTSISTELNLRLHVLQIGTWAIAWLLHTIAMVVYNLHRGDLGARVLACGIPFVLSVLSPLVTIGSLKRFDRIQWDHPRWATATLYTGTTVMAITYVLTPRRYRYDPDSPTAPSAHAKISDIDQVTALIAGLMFIAPHFILTWDKARLWLNDRLRDVSLTALSGPFSTCASRLLLYVSQIASSIVDWLCALQDMIIARIANIQAFLHTGLTKDDGTEASNM